MRHLLEKYKTDISRFTLVPSGRGRFEVTVDGELTFSKVKEGRFPEHEEIDSRLAGRRGDSGSRAASCCEETAPVQRKGKGFRSLVAEILRKAV
jgi:selT/selW/selH-like putative selenoprotein